MRVLVLSLVLSLGAFAHTDLSKTIEALSAKIAKKPTAELYFQRALEYRALREKEHTLEDLRKAIELKPNFRDARFALAEELGKSDEALRLALELTAAPGSSDDSFPSNLLLIRVHQRRGEHKAALKLCKQLDEKTRDARKDDTGLALLHAGILLDLKRPGEAADVLKAAWERTDSIVARNNWIDTALSAGRAGETLPLIEEELRTSRLRSSWFIRRARALLILEKKKEARSDLVSALLEINRRLNPARPDLTLIADRGLIHALMGNKALAGRDMKILQDSTFPTSAYRLLNEQLAEE